MSSFDHDLALAIAPPLQPQQSQAPNSRDNPIVVVGSDDEEDSVSSSPPKTTGNKAAVRPNKSSGLPATHEYSGPKRSIASTKRQESIASLTRKRRDIEDGTNDEDSDLKERPSKRSCLPVSSSSGSAKGKSKETISYPGSFGIPDENGHFWHGAIRQTTNKYTIPSQDNKPVLGFTDILPPITSSDPDQTLSFAILSAYVADLSWLRKHFSQDVPVILVGEPGEDGRPGLTHPLPGWVQTSPGLAGGKGCMHVKLMLLFFKSGRLRIVITTANFEQYDWEDIENSVWLQDVPRCALPTPAPVQDPSLVLAKHEDEFLFSIPRPPRPQSCELDPENFAERLEYTLECLHVKPALEAHLSGQRASQGVALPLKNIGELHARWDWRHVTARLIPSIAGRHVGWPEVNGLGHVALMNAIRNMDAASKSTKIECQGSSIGYYSPDWTNEFMSSARGISPDTWLDIPKSRRAKAPHPDGLRIVFPSLATVNESVLGQMRAGTIFCRRAQWELSHFPKELFVDSNSKRGKILMHSKASTMILGTLSEQGKPPGWLYVGSHNLTPSAWGRLYGDQECPKMHIANYELGVVIPLENAAQGNDLACWKRPARPYIMGQDLPWIQDENMSIWNFFHAL